MSKIQPVSSSTKFNSIIVQPASDKYINTKISEEIKPSNVKVLGIPINKRESHIQRSNSNVSKLIRFIKADEYTTYDTKFSKALIIISILNMIMLAILFIFILANMDKKSSSMYVLDSLVTDEFKEKNKELDGLNVVSKVSQYTSVIIGSITLVCSVAQFYYVYKHNDFKSKKITPNNTTE